MILFPSQPLDLEDENHHNHAGQRLMAAPLLVLAGVTLGLGFCQKWLADFLGSDQLHAHSPAGHNDFLAVTALALVLAGILIAFFEFGRKNAVRKGGVERYPKLAELFAQRWYLDHFYRYMLDHVVYKGISAACSENDRRIIDGGLDALADGTIACGRLLAKLMAGMLQYRLMVILAVMVLTVFYILY